MNPILLDTNAYVAFKRGHPQALSAVQNAPTIALNPVVLGELLSGFAAGDREKANRDELAEFLASPRVSVLPMGYATAEQYATVFRTLRTVGTPIPTNDMWIAASAIEYGIDLLSYDAHFQAVGGLHLVPIAKDG